MRQRVMREIGRAGEPSRRMQIQQTGDPAPFVRGVKWHSLANADYWRAIFRASYYAWASRKPFVGRDPIDGREHRFHPEHMGAERAANIAQARYWYRVAADIRERKYLDVLTARCADTV